MKKSTKIIITVAVVIILIAFIIGVIIFMNSKSKTNLNKIESAEDLSKLVEQIYEGQDIELPSLQTQIIDITDDMMVQSITGLKNGENLELLVTSEPMMSSQAYSLVIAKVKNNVNVEEIAKNMNENINQRKWICVSAEKVYTTSSGNVVFLVMSSEKVARPIYEKFKLLAGSIGQEYEKTEEEPELPPEMY